MFLRDKFTYTPECLLNRLFACFRLDAALYRVSIL
jgi:hypothetical protein